MRKLLASIGLSAIALIGISFGLTSCLDSGSEDSTLVQLEKEIKAIDDFLAANNITAVTDHRGIRMVISELGTGLPAKINNTINVDYVGKLFSDNSIFDQGNIKGPLSSYIDGWKIALTTLPAGSKAKVYIPSYWAYGNTGAGSIPGNATLIFDIVFNSVTQSSQDIQRFSADTTAISEYLELNNIDAMQDTTGVSYVVTELGTGATPSWFDKVTFTYSVKLLNAETKVVFTETVEPAEDFFSRVVYFNHGWKIALQRIPKGSKATFYMPSGHAYGTVEQRDATGLVTIPGNSNIIVELELVDVVPE